MSFFPAPYFGRFHHGGGSHRHWGSPSINTNSGLNDIAPFFRMVDAAIDNFVSPSNAGAPWATAARRHGETAANDTPKFNPRFDVRESEGRYELRGELPGVEAENLEVKFADEQTLVIKGRTATEKTAGTPPAGAVEGTNGKAVDNGAATEDTAASRRSSSSSYVKPTVEDDAEDNTTAASTSTAAPGEQPKEAAPEQQRQENPFNYWYSERSTGTFQRTFNFPSHVDQDGVTANLKNGILDVVVPKRKIEEGRRINVGSA
ncbi:MAG: hypothetical protein M1831_002517 [Alyxoria varia]|nr:MAG: hypothetical protein M1831_002517 [Alyxoria varia]